VGRCGSSRLPFDSNAHLCRGVAQKTDRPVPQGNKSLCCGWRFMPLGANSTPLCFVAAPARLNYSLTFHGCCGAGDTGKFPLPLLCVGLQRAFFVEKEADGSRPLSFAVASLSLLSLSRVCVCVCVSLSLSLLHPYTHTRAWGLGGRRRVLCFFPSRFASRALPPPPPPCWKRTLSTPSRSHHHTITLSITHTIVTPVC
jgi:hypothetical protein